MRQALLLSAVMALAAQARAISIFLVSSTAPACTSPSGAIDISVSGGTPPYTYMWTTGATTEDLSDLPAGYYEVTVTDALSDQATQGWTLVVTTLYSPSSAQDGHASCVGSMGGEVQVIEWGINGVPPYSYNPPPDAADAQGDPVFYFPFTPPGTDVSIDVTDALGCSGTLIEPIIGPQTIGGTGPDMVLGAVAGSCSAGTGGSVTITNVYDGYFFQGPQLTLLDAFDVYVDQTWNAGNTVEYTGLAPGDYHLIRDWDPSDVYMAYPCDGNPHDRIDLTIPDLGPDCGSVSGTVFIDNDQDCVQDVAEVGVPYEVLEIQPGPQYAITDGTGSFAFDITNGSYDLSQTSAELVQLCPASVPVPFTVADNVSVIDLADSSTVPLDLTAQLESGPMRPGFSGTFWGLVRNLSPQVSGFVSVTMQLDIALTFSSAAPTPTSVIGNTITWALAEFSALHQRSFSVIVDVPAGTPIGTPIVSTLFVSNTLPEGGGAPNLATLNDVVVGSYDPNVKTARTSSASSTSQFFIGLDEWIDYTIQFQNTGTDTAFTVVVTDTLSTDLDMATFQQGVASHAFSVAFRPVRVVEWRFENILLPDSGTNEGESHGLVSFRIRPVQPLLPGTIMSNAANIYFDFNDPVITGPSVLTAEFSTATALVPVAPGNLVLFPNPTSDELTIVGPPGTMMLAFLPIRAADGRAIRLVPAANGTWDVQSLAPGIYTVRMGGAVGRFVKH